jgi:DNA adenine methylase
MARCAVSGVVQQGHDPTTNEATLAARPILKWPGGKTKLLGELTARMPARFGRYYEPFAGGAALFFRLAPERAVLADANAHLVSTYEAIAHETGQVIAELERHGNAHSEPHYNAMKARWNCGAGNMVYRAAAFVYLNKAGFNGLYRVNARGEFNVGWGKHASYTPDVDGLRAAGAVLARAELRTGDYRAALYDARPGDFVYLDPPYDGTFSAYTSGKFGDVDQAEIAFTVRTLAARGVQVMLSNADTPRVRALYAGLRIDVVHAPRAINRDGAGRGKVAEVIVTAGWAP